MALGEHFIDLVNLLPPVAGRTARPERRPELRTWHVLPPHSPAGQTPGLARQIIERQLEGLEPAAETFGVHQAIGRRRGIGYGHGTAHCPQGGHRGIIPPEIIPEDMDARDKPPAFSAACCEVFPRIEELEGGRGVPALADGPPGIGREIGGAAGSFTTRPRAAMMIRRRMADSAGRRTRSTARCRGCGIRPTTASPSSPSMANRAAIIPLSASLLRLMAKAQSKSTCLPIQHENITGTNWHSRNIVSRGINSYSIIDYTRIVLSKTSIMNSKPYSLAPSFRSKSAILR